jgi:hypothetical protein
MSVKMRILQTYDPAHEADFLALEKKFAVLEKRRPDFPQGRRFKPVASSLCTHTLVWEGEFKDLNAAHAALNFFPATPSTRNWLKNKGLSSRKCGCFSRSFDRRYLSQTAGF